MKKPKENSQKLPILRGFVDGKTIRVYCPYCNIWHIHSWDGNTSHRTPHCISELTPFRQAGGYVIAEFRKKDKCVATK